MTFEEKLNFKSTFELITSVSIENGCISIIKHLPLKVNNRVQKRRQQAANKTSIAGQASGEFFHLILKIKITSRRLFERGLCWNLWPLLCLPKKKKLDAFTVFTEIDGFYPHEVKTWKHSQHKKIRLGIQEDSFGYSNILENFEPLGITGCTPHFFGASAELEHVFS